MHLLPLLPAGPLPTPGTLRPPQRRLPRLGAKIPAAGGGGRALPAALLPLRPFLLGPFCSSSRDWHERGKPWVGEEKMCRGPGRICLAPAMAHQPGTRVASTAAASQLPDGAALPTPGTLSLGGKGTCPCPGAGSCATTFLARVRVALRSASESIPQPLPSLPGGWRALERSANQRRDRAGAEGPAQRPGTAGSCQGRRAAHVRLPGIPILQSMRS